MNLQHRVDLLVRLGSYILSSDPVWARAKKEASLANEWFIPEFVDMSANQIAKAYLSKNKLEAWVKKYELPPVNNHPKTVGIVMAGNIPLVGFHDFLSVFVTGHLSFIKPSSKDQVLIKHLVLKLEEWEPSTKDLVRFSDGMLKDCDAYIATGGNNSSRYFEYYFSKYPHIIRRNRTSVAILTGDEPDDELQRLADDVYLYFGLGCRNVTKLYVPADYDFTKLLAAFKKYNYLAGHPKYKNNYDYNLALLMLNSRPYMTNQSIILTENPSVFSPVSQLNYEYYDKEGINDLDKNSEDLQCIAGRGRVAFGQAQYPSLDDFADGINTVRFLINL